MTIRTLDRRRFFRTAAVTAGAVAALPAFRGLGLLGLEDRVFAAPSGGYGPLAPAADLRDGAMRISLPAGFQYRSFSPSGAVMSDGHRVPIALDGMGVFNMKSGRFRLVRNHEDRNAPGAGTTAIDANAYDTRGGGGTTTLVVNPFTRELERDFISLNGTTVNCAGGVTPWGSWITCEETNVGPPAWEKQHGYSFDVPAAANASVPAVAIPEMGRFSHEACAVDPRTWIVYETEDNGNTSGFYRFLPNTRGVLTDGGRLQMLAIDGMPNYMTQTGQTVGAALPVAWVDIAEPDPPRSATPSTDVFNQGWARGGASFGPLCGPKREFCTRCVRPHSGPSRAKRGKRHWQPVKGLGGDIKGRSLAEPLDWSARGRLVGQQGRLLCGHQRRRRRLRSGVGIPPARRPR
jgi:hypothetical protein